MIWPGGSLSAPWESRPSRVPPAPINSMSVGPLSCSRHPHGSWPSQVPHGHLPALSWQPLKEHSLHKGTFTHPQQWPPSTHGHPAVLAELEQGPLVPLWHGSWGESGISVSCRWAHTAIPLPAAADPSTGTQQSQGCSYSREVMPSKSPRAWVDVITSPVVPLSRQCPSLPQFTSLESTFSVTAFAGKVVSL